MNPMGTLCWVWSGWRWEGKGGEGAEPLVQLCQPRAWVPGALSLSSGQQHPVPAWNLEGVGVSTQPCPHGLQGAGGCGEHPSVLVLEGNGSPRTGKGSALPFAAWAAQRACAGTRLHSSSRVKS